MKWYEKLFRRQPKTVKMAPMLDGYSPFYSQFGGDIFQSDVVRQAISCIVNEFMKLKPTHIRVSDQGDPSPVQRSTVQTVLRNPNPLMTTSEYLSKICWLLMLNDNAFVVPVYETWIDDATGAERRYYEALYPISPGEVNFIEDGSGELFVNFIFKNGYSTTIPYKDVIHVKRNYSVDEYMGGGHTGQPDKTAIAETVDLNRRLLAGVAKAMDASYSVNGFVKYSTIFNEEETANAVKEFNKKLRNNESGFIPVDMATEITPFSRTAAIVDEPTLKFVDEKILRNWGVPLCILKGDYTKEQYEAFYQSTLETLALSVAEAHTKKLFTSRELAFGNRVELYPKDLIFMTVSQTLEMINILAPTGAMTENEKRTALGLRPLPELSGKRYMSLNWIDANNADQYQVGKVNVDVVDEEKTEV